MTFKILITGSSGQLGQSLQYWSHKYPNWTFLPFSNSKLDITDSKLLKNILNSQRPDMVINCAAYTAVDKAEEEVEKAFLVNRDGPKNLAELCEEMNTPLVHFSTDYVYHSRNEIPFFEEDEKNPQSIYAKSKFEGELAIRETGCLALIIRTSWVYSPYGHNFVKTMLTLGKSRGNLDVVNDQIGSPTYAIHLAQTVLEIVDQYFKGQVVGSVFNQTYNYSNNGFCSWYDFAKTIFQKSNLTCIVSPVDTDAFSRPASRPPFSVLNTEKIIKTFKVKINSWEEALEECLALLH